MGFNIFSMSSWGDRIDAILHTSSASAINQCLCRPLFLRLESTLALYVILATMQLVLWNLDFSLQKIQDIIPTQGD